MEELWIDELKRRFAEDTIPLPEGDWEEFWARYVRRKRQKQTRRAFYVASTLVAAAVALFFINRTVPELENKDVPVTDTHALSVIQRENMEEVETLIAAVSPRTVVSPVEVIPETLSPDNSQKVNDDNAVNDEETGNGQAPEPQPCQDHFAFTDEIRDLGRKNHKLHISPYISGAGAVKTTEMAHRFPGQLRKLFPEIFPQTVPGKDLYTPIDGKLFSLEGSHSIPLSFGLETKMAISRRTDVTSGIDISRYRSRFLVNNESVTQNAYYLGIPLRLSWTAWENGSLETWVGAGGKVDRMVYGKLGSERIKDNSLHWSVTAVAGIQYGLFSNVGIFVEPELSYYFKPSDSVIQTYRTENPLMFTVGAGLRITLR